MNTQSFEQLNISNGDIIGFTTEDGQSCRCYYYGGYNKVKGVFTCYNFKSGRIEDVALANVKTMQRA